MGSYEMPKSTKSSVLLRLRTHRSYASLYFVLLFCFSPCDSQLPAILLPRFVALAPVFIHIRY